MLARAGCVMTEPQASKPIGFWGCWALVVGCMIGSGILMLPAQLAPFGMVGLIGLIVAGAGAIALALVFARQAERTKCDGGPYAYSRQAFGDLTGFLMGWAYWLSFVAGVPTVAMAFVSYLGVFVPGLATNPLGQMASGIALIAAFTFINIRGLKEMSVTQITLTVLKIIPLVAIIAIAIPAGEPTNASAFNPSGQSIFAALTLTALIALWPFTGFEVVTLPAGNVKDCERTIPRALITGMLTVVAIYLSATVAVMLLVPPAQLVQSTAPFSDAAQALGPWGPHLIAAGALVATAGTINGLIFTCGQMPLAVAADKLAPSWLAALSKHGTPHLALLVSSALGIVLLVLTNTRGLMGSFQFMLTIATSLGLFYYVVVSLAELRHSVRASAVAGVAASIIGIAYSVFAAFGSGAEVFLWCIVLMAAGVPLYFVFKRNNAAPAPSPTS